MGKHPNPRILQERREKQELHELATLSTDSRCARRQYPLTRDAFRTEFHRDYTRIIHSRAFRRLRHKTQVFISPRNDHLCTRLEHSLHVASVATTIARALRLNEDLVRAIAVGHDLGHAPFGHKGQDALRVIAEKHGLTFSHELHSLRVVDFVESPYSEYPGLNLTFAVRDGIACHYGEGFERDLRPDRKKLAGALEKTKRGKSLPATLEGCVVRWADKIAYLGRDLEDALTLKLVRRQELPAAVRKTLGVSNRRIIGTLVRELVRNGIEDDALSVSPRIHDALNQFYAFNMKRIYNAGFATRHYEQIDRAMQALFGYLQAKLPQDATGLRAMAKADERCLRVFAEFLEDDIRDWRSQNPSQVVVDYIAGMTDSFFVESFSELFLPRGTV